MVILKLQVFFGRRLLPEGGVWENNQKNKWHGFFFFFSILDKCSYVTKPSPDSAYFFFFLAEVNLELCLI